MYLAPLRVELWPVYAFSGMASRWPVFYFAHAGLDCSNPAYISASRHNAGPPSRGAIRYLQYLTSAL